MDFIKSYIPSFSSIKSSISNASSSVSKMMSDLTMNETEYLYKREHTEKEILNFLSSKMEMEVIYALKIIIIDIQNQKDINIYIPRVLDIFVINNDYYIKCLCLNIIDNITLVKREELILLYNVIGKLSHNIDPINRMCLLHMISSLSKQGIQKDTFKSLLDFINDSNPLIRRITLIIIINYYKDDKSLIEDEELKNILKKYLYDSNPIIFSTFFFAIIELGNSDYLSFGLHNKFEDICMKLNYIDNFYFERVIFVLINFTHIYLKHNLKNESNVTFIILLFHSLYNCMKQTTDFNKEINCIIGLISLIKEFENNLEFLNNILKMKKENNRLKKICFSLLKCLFESNNNNDINLSLDIISQIIINNNNNEINNKIREYYSKYINYFFINDINEMEIFSEIKIKILSYLINKNNVKQIINEFKREISFLNINLGIYIINQIYFISIKYKDVPEIIEVCIEKLVDMLKIKEGKIINNVIINLSKLMDNIGEQKKYILIYAIKNYSKNITSPYALSSIINMIGKYINIIPTVSIDFFRRLLINIDKESIEVKKQILSLAFIIHKELENIIDNYKENKENIKNKIEKLINYSIEKLLYDNDYDVRNKSRMIKVMINNKIKLLPLDKEINIEKKEDKNEKFENNYFMEVITNNNKEINKYKYDDLSSENIENMKNISINELIQLDNSLNNTTKEEILKKSEENNDKYSSIKQQEQNTNDKFSNITSNLNIEEKKKMLKNQLDAFLNDDDENDEEDDDVQVEIKKG